MEASSIENCAQQKKVTSKSVNILILVTYFAAFAIAYCAPMFIYGLESAIEDGRVRQLLDAVLANTDAQQAIAINTATHLALLGAVFVLLIGMADSLARSTSTPDWMARTLTLLLGWILLLSGNAVLFPFSRYTFAFPFLKNQLLAATLALAFATGILYLLLHNRLLRRTLLVIAIAGSAIYAINPVASEAHDTPPTDRRNVIIIGVDSLSFTAFEQLRNELPMLNGLLSNGTYYERAYTPLGRTFPAWASVLSGKNPADHGALFNLRNLDHVNKQNLISTQLQKAGYHTVFSIDERRFNNMDEAFGFDAVVGPAAGALDFVMQQTNDAPLTNLLLQTSVARSLLSFSYINTQSVPNYDSDAFVGATLSATETSKPLFAAVHFESAHYPYHTRHAEREFNTPNQFWNSHAAALTVVDQQVAQLMDGLKQRGHLKNALVIVLSDHGEGLGYQESSLKLDDHPRELRGYGHGARLLSDHQNHIILGVTEYQDGSPVSQKTTESAQVSLLDIRPLIERYISEGAARLQPENECLIVETGLRLAEADDYRTLDPAEVAAGSARFYEIDARGRMRLKEDQLHNLVETKDVGWRCRNHITVHFFANDEYQSVLLDEDGIARTIQPVPAQDVSKITAYRRRLMSAVKERDLPK